MLNYVRLASHLTRGLAAVSALQLIRLRLHLDSAKWSNDLTAPGALPSLRNLGTVTMSEVKSNDEIERCLTAVMPVYNESAAVVDVGLPRRALHPRASLRYDRSTQTQTGDTLEFSPVLLAD
jgi:hypothetical protein